MEDPYEQSVEDRLNFYRKITTVDDFTYQKSSDIYDKKVDWIIPDLIQENSVTVLYGNKGSCKTLLAMSIAYSLSSSKEILGRAEGMERKTVGYLAFEDPQQIHHRLKFYHDKLNKDGDRYDGRKSHFSIFEDSIKFSLKPTDESLKDIAKLEYLAKHHSILILDTLSHTFPVGYSENEAHVMRAVVHEISRIASKCNCTFLLLHHTTQNTTNPRGSTELENTAQTMLFTNGKQIVVKKQRHGKVGRTIKFDLEVEDDYAIPVFQNILDSYPEHEKWIINLLSEIAENKIPRDECLELFKKRFKTNRQTFKRALDPIVKNGHVTREQIDKQEILFLNYEN
tara:strand:- start:161 stop:1180 length:1020 start_codon:yes stop_codon:yes gene_type:complete